MENSHSRHRQSAPAARAATMHGIPSPSHPHSLLRRGSIIVRSMLNRRDCVSNQHINTCEKPALSTDSSLAIMLVVGIVALLIILGILFMLHLRRRRRDKAEMENDNHQLSDYGLDDIPAKKGAKSSYLQRPAPIQQHRLSAQELVANAQNPFGGGAELADSDKPSRIGNPPSYPEAAKM